MKTNHDSLSMRAERYDACKDCTVENTVLRPSLAEILAPEPLGRQLLFWLAMALCLALIHSVRISFYGFSQGAG